MLKLKLDVQSRIKNPYIYNNNAFCLRWSNMYISVQSQWVTMTVASGCKNSFWYLNQIPRKAFANFPTYRSHSNGTARAWRPSSSTRWPLKTSGPAWRAEWWWRGGPAGREGPWTAVAAAAVGRAAASSSSLVGFILKIFTLLYLLNICRWFRREQRKSRGAPNTELNSNLGEEEQEEEQSFHPLGQRQGEVGGEETGRGIN